MTREIKFRAWDKKNKLFITNDDEVKEYMIGLDGKLYRMDFYSNILGEEDGILIWNELKDIILMQYTGLVDKNGKDIYEGDIVKYDGELTTVIFCYGSFFLEKFNFWSSDWVNADNMIVKGNIYDNPELLKEDK